MSVKYWSVTVCSRIKVGAKLLLMKISCKRLQQRPTGGDHVLEVGPGIGALTEKLAQKAGFLTALEIDSRLLPLLQETLGRYENITVLHQDALHADYGGCAPRPFEACCQSPYNIRNPCCTAC